MKLCTVLSIKRCISHMPPCLQCTFTFPAFISSCLNSSCNCFCHYFHFLLFVESAEAVPVQTNYCASCIEFSVRPCVMLLEVSSSKCQALPVLTACLLLYRYLKIKCPFPHLSGHRTARCLYTCNINRKF